MRDFLSLIFLVFSVSAVSAQTASIRAGEHEGFSRLVITIPTEAAWNVGRTNRGFGLKVSTVLSYDFSTVFDRIPKRRITEFTQLEDGNSLLIASNCDCFASAFLWQPDKLVVDIRDGIAPQNSSFNGSFYEPIAYVGLPIITRQPKVNSLDLSYEIDEESEANQLKALEEIVISSIARGAIQGLLQPSTDISAAQTAPFDIHISENKPGLLAHTSIERAPQDDATSVIDVCFADEHFDIPKWGSDDPFHSQISQLRGLVIGEFDRPDRIAVENLARGFLYFGFGREARNALTIDAELSVSRSILIAIAAIMDGDPPSNVLAQQANCNGPAALWGFLSVQGSSQTEDERNAVLRAFKALPFHLQTHLGPMLSEKFIQIGDLESAEVSLVSSGMAVDPTFESLIATTEIQTELGEVIRATDTLAMMAASDSRMTPKALIDLMHFSIEAKTPVDPEVVALADILRFEHQDTEIAGDLAAAQVAVLIASQNVQLALKIVSEEVEALGADRSSALQTAALMAATEIYDDMEFIKVAFDKIGLLVDPDAQNAMAQRLLILGFPERAAALVRSSSVGNTMIERRYLRAEAALASGNSDGALIHLQGQTSARAIQLRRSVDLILEGQEDIASDSMSNDWRLGNWSTLSQGGDALLQEVSLSILNETVVVPDVDQPLGQGRDLLVQSEITRALLGDVLARFAPVLD